MFITQCILIISFFCIVYAGIIAVVTITGEYEWCETLPYIFTGWVLIIAIGVVLASSIYADIKTDNILLLSM